MCMLFGLSALKETITNEYLKTFFCHSPEHPHGWGMAIIEGNGALIERESIEASKSNYLKERLSEPVPARLMLAHIRYATIGNVEYRNCHPFSGRDAAGRRWTLVHNGTIFDYPPLSYYLNLQNGETDSERILLYLLDRLNAAQKDRELSFEDRFDLLDAIISDMSKGNKLNLMLSDGENLYVHTNCRDTLFRLAGEAVFASVPLTDGPWESVPFATLLAYRDGTLVRTGANHGHAYIEDPEHMKYLYQIFSDL